MQLHHSQTQCCQSDERPKKQGRENKKGTNWTRIWYSKKKNSKNKKNTIMTLTIITSKPAISRTGSKLKTMGRVDCVMVNVVEINCKDKNPINVKLGIFQRKKGKINKTSPRISDFHESLP